MPRLSGSFETLGQSWIKKLWHLLYIREPAPTVKTVFCLKGIITIHTIYTAQAENRRASDSSTGPPYPESKNVSSQTPVPSLADLCRTITI